MFIGDGEGDAEMLYHVLVLKFTFPKTEGTKSFLINVVQNIYVLNI